MADDDEEMDLEALGLQAVERAQRDIETFGWHMLMVAGDDDEDEAGFLFTIGLWKTCGHPEILLFARSADPTTLTEPLDDLARRIQAGERFEAESVHPGVFGPYAGAFRTIAPVWYPYFLGTAMGVYEGGEFPALQMFWPDREGVFPWESGFDAGLTSFQPLLFETVLHRARVPASVAEALDEAGDLEVTELTPEDLFVAVDPADEEALLADWRWKIGPDAELLQLTVFGDLFLETPDGHVHFLDTARSTYEEVAESVEEWGPMMPVRGPEWFHAEVLLELLQLDARPEPGFIYSWRQPLFLGGEESLDNVGFAAPVAYVSHAGRTAEAVEGLPPGTRIDKLGFEPL